MRRTVLLLIVVAAVAQAQTPAVQGIRAYCRELDAQWAKTPDGDDRSSFGTVRLGRVLPGSGPQATDVVYRSVETADGRTPWRRRSVLQRAVLTQNVAAVAERLEFTYRDGALVLGIARSDTGDAEWDEYYFAGKTLLAAYRAGASGRAVIPAAIAHPRARLLRSSGEQLAIAFSALAAARE